MNIFKKSAIASLPLLLVAVLAVWYLNQQPKQEVIPSPSPTPQVEPSDKVSYPGEEGVDSLTLLHKSAIVEQDNSGLVVSINGRRADATAREYWAFYVNGELAPVGPADYKTKAGDKIEWKVEKF